MPESPEGRKQESDESLEDFREEILEDYGPEGLDQKSEDVPKEGINGDEQKHADAGGDDGRLAEGSGLQAEDAERAPGDSAGAPESTGDPDRLASDDDLEKLRQQIVEQFGSEGLEEDTTEERHRLALEETEQAGASGVADQAEKGAKEQADAESAIGSMTEDGRGETEPATGSDIEKGVADAAIERRVGLSETSTTATAIVESYSWNDNQIVMTEQLRQPGDDGVDGSSMETSDLQHLQRDSPHGRPGGANRTQSAVKAPETVSEKVPGLTDFPVTTGVGRYSRNDNQVVVTVPKDGEDGGGPDKTSAVSPERPEADDVIRHAAKYMSSTGLLIPDSRLPEHREDDVLAVCIARENEGWKEYTLYCKEKPGADRAYLDLKQIGAEEGEGFRIRQMEVLRPEVFARDYNHSKPKGLENTELLVDGASLEMKVDGTELRLEGAKLRSQEGSAVLDASLAGQKAFKIVEGQSGFALRLEDHSPIVSMSKHERFVAIDYARTGHDTRPHRTYVEIERVEPKAAHKVEFKETHLMIKEMIEEQSGRRRVEFSIECRAIALQYWREGIEQSKQERDYHIGDIGEAVLRVAFRESDYTLLPRELYRNGGNNLTHDSEYRGPDLVVKKQGNHVVFIKHWKERFAGLNEAKGEVTSFGNSARRTKLEDKLGIRFQGGFAIELDWSYKEPSGVIYMEYVKYQ